MGHSFLKTLFVVFALIFVVNGRSDAAPGPPWNLAQTFGGPGQDWANAIKADDQGNTYVAGYFSDTATFAGKTRSSAGGFDMFLAKRGPQGQLRWLLQIGGPADDSAKDIALDRAGNIYVTGWFTNTATFRSVNAASSTAVGAGETVFIVKYSPDGTLEWLRTGHSVIAVGLNRGYGVAVDRTDGTVYLTGLAQSETLFASSDGAEHIVLGPPTWHMILVKYDAAGNFLWGQWNQASPNSIAEKVAVDADGSAYVTGWLEGVTSFHGSNGRERIVTGFSGPVQVFPYPDDAFLAKYDVDGKVEWVNHIGGYKAIGTDIALSGYGRISIAGFVGNVNFEDSSQAETIVTSQPGGTNISLGGGKFTKPFNPDAFIATYDPAGVLVGARRIGGALADEGSGIAYDPAGNLYVSGLFHGAVDFGGQTVTGDQPSNLFVLKYTRAGAGATTANKLDWVKVAEGAGTDSPEADPRLCVIPPDRIFVVGAYRGTAAFDTVALHSAGKEDAFLAELVSTGH